MITTKQLAEQLGISDARVRQLAAAGRITGAHQYGRAWLFTEGARVLDAPQTRKLKDKARGRGQRWDPKEQRYQDR